MYQNLYWERIKRKEKKMGGGLVGWVWVLCDFLGSNPCKAG
jgi:hypothetical protein